MAKKKKESAGSPKWMATFADMSTLLLTFFVLMLSMSTIDLERFREMLGSIKEAFGVQFDQRGQYQAVLPDEVVELMLDPGEGEWEQTPPETVDEFDYSPEEQPEVDAAAAEEARRLEEERQEREEAVAEIQQAVDQTGMRDLTEVQSGTRGIRIRVKGALLFDPGSATLKAEAKPLLDNLVLVLQKFDYHLLVEGHTDSTPIATAQFPSNWELSGSRAAAVLRYLLTWGLSPDRMACVGLADLHPLDDNSTAEGRAANRRVEFVLTKTPFRPSISDNGES